jgi:rod shape-determining protein MreD
VKLAGILAALVAALTAETALARYWIDQGPLVDLVLVVVVWVAIRAGAAHGLVAGTVGGLLQDAVSGGILGVGGLAKTVVGFLVGVAAQQFIVAGPVPRLAVFFLATWVQAVCVALVYALLPRMGGFDVPYRAVATQATANAVVGLVSFEVAEWAPLIWRRRRDARARRGRPPVE